MVKMEEGTTYTISNYYKVIPNHCELCGTKILYNYGIVNDNGHEMIVGSECILKFDVRRRGITGYKKYTKVEEVEFDLSVLQFQEIINRIGNIKEQQKLKSMLKLYITKKVQLSPHQILTIMKAGDATGLRTSLPKIKINLQKDDMKRKIINIMETSKYEGSLLLLCLSKQQQESLINFNRSK